MVRQVFLRKVGLPLVVANAIRRSGGAGGDRERSKLFAFG
jgi:hypothetical protein